VLAVAARYDEYKGSGVDQRGVSIVYACILGDALFC